MTLTLPIGELVENYSLDEYMIKIDSLDGYQEVTQLFNKGVKPIYKLELENGAELEGSYNHLVETTEGFKPLNELTKSDIVLTSFGNEVITGIYRSGEGTVYDMTVNHDNHRYITSNGISSHNTGKSYNINLLRKHYAKTVVLATTGIAAINVKGETYHSFLCIDLIDNLDDLKKSDEQNKFTYRFQDMQESLSNTNLLIIDEVSMMNSAQLKMVLYRLRNFPKIKLLLVGDFPQLPPVDGVPLYMSKTFTEKFSPLKLSKQRRQSEDDTLFNKLLYSVRNCVVDEADWEFMHLLEKNEVKNAIKLRALNSEVRDLNELGLKEIKTDLLQFSRVITFKDKRIDKFVLDGILNNLREPEVFQCKIGARVMVTKNLKKKGLYNGDLATVIATEGSKSIMLHVDRLNSFVWVEKSIYSYELVHKGSKITALSYEAFPLILGYALTIHKSQGLTLDKVDIGCMSIFDPNMFYVALSRAKHSSGVQLHDVDTLAFRKNRKLKTKWYTK